MIELAFYRLFWMDEGYLVVVLITQFKENAGFRFIAKFVKHTSPFVPDRLELVGGCLFGKGGESGFLSKSFSAPPI